MVEQPQGTVTFLFTDIEGSTRLLRELGRDAYAPALEQHRRALRAAFARHGGYEVDCEGDAFVVAFQSAGGAVAAAAEAQAALRDGPMQVRMGLHTGEPLLAPPKYVGLEVHKAARIMAAGHGGQVLLSQATRELVEAEVHDLGFYRLKDIGEPVRLYQLGDNKFPPLRPTTESPLLGPLEVMSDGVAFLHWRDGEDVQRILVLPADRGRVTVGRRVDSDVSLSWDAEVSRAHALLEFVGGQWTLVDDGLSRNGSFVNSSRLHGRHRLRDRDRLCFGNTHVIYREPVDSEGGDSTARAPGAPALVPLSGTQRKVLIALCRPLSDSTSRTPATNRQIAEEVFLSVDAVKAHLRLLFERFGVGKLPQNEKRAQLAFKVLDAGVLAPHEF